QHDASVRHAGVRPRSADLGARHVLPHARRRQPLRRRRIVLSLVSRRQSGADDPRAGAARRGSHSGGDDMKSGSFSHVGITVSDFNRAVKFWWEIFGCPLVGVSGAPEERVRGFFGNDTPGATCRIGWIRFPGGAVIEIFHFEPKLPAEKIEWPRVG